MPSGDIEKSMIEYDIDHVAASFDELYSVLEKWSAMGGNECKYCCFVVRDLKPWSLRHFSM
jgi:hypothetical protein